MLHIELYSLCSCVLALVPAYWFYFWCSSISYLSSLLDKEDRSVRIAAGEALALIFEIGDVDKFSTEAKNASDLTQESKPQESFIFLQGLKGKVINQCKNLSAEAGGKGSAKKDLNSQRNLFRDILDFFEVCWWYSYSPFFFHPFILLFENRSCSTHESESEGICTYPFIVICHIRMVTPLKFQWRLVVILYRHRRGPKWYRFFLPSFIWFFYTACIAFWHLDFCSWISLNTSLEEDSLNICRLDFCCIFPFFLLYLIVVQSL